MQMIIFFSGCEESKEALNTLRQGLDVSRHKFDDQSLVSASEAACARFYNIPHVAAQPCVLFLHSLLRKIIPIKKKKIYYNAIRIASGSYKVYA
jgi:hypothetical protein